MVSLQSAQLLPLTFHSLQAEEFELLPSGRVRIHASKLGIARKPEEAAPGPDKGPVVASPLFAAAAPEKMAQSVRPLL